MKWLVICGRAVADDGVSARLDRRECRRRSLRLEVDLGDDILASFLCCVGVPTLTRFHTCTYESRVRNMRRDKFPIEPLILPGPNGSF